MLPLQTVIASPILDLVVRILTQPEVAIQDVAF